MIESTQPSFHHEALQMPNPRAGGFTWTCVLCISARLDLARVEDQLATLGIYKIRSNRVLMTDKHSAFMIFLIKK